MKRLACLLLAVFALPALLSGCGRTEPGGPGPGDPTPGDPAPGAVESDSPSQGVTITNMNIPVADITDFYYTYENINFNAHYQRYRFYREDEKYWFFHETRDKPEEYGWTTEEDTTAIGTYEMTEEQWLEVMDLLKDGTVTRRGEDSSTGSSGPWTYIYWKNDKSDYQQYSFASGSDKLTFEDHCLALVEELGSAQ